MMHIKFKTMMPRRKYSYSTRLLSPLRRHLEIMNSNITSIKYKKSHLSIFTINLLLFPIYM